MSNPDLTRIAGSIDTLNALNSLKYINKYLAIYQTGQATDKCPNIASEDHYYVNIACTFDVDSRGAKREVYTIGEIKNLMSTMEDGMKMIRTLLLKMKDKVNEASYQTMDECQRAIINNQVQDWIVEIESIVINTQWNGKALIGGIGSVSFVEFLSISDGTCTQKKYLMAVFDTASLGINNLDVTGASVSGTYIKAQSAIQSAINKINEAICDVREFNARLNFMEDVLNLIRNSSQLVNDRIKNANMAAEQVKASKLLILQQTSTALRAQANVTPRFLLSLFN